eukprot:869736_1
MITKIQCIDCVVCMRQIIIQVLIDPSNKLAKYIRRMIAVCGIIVVIGITQLTACSIVTMLCLVTIPQSSMFHGQELLLSLSPHVLYEQTPVNYVECACLAT